MCIRDRAQREQEAKRAQVQSKYIPVNEIPKLNVGLAQPKTQVVAQSKPQAVAQAVAQGSWVAQKGPQAVAQKDPQKVAQKTLADFDIQRLKEEIYIIQGVEARKKFVVDNGFGISSEKRGKKTYLFGIKKLEGIKYKLYIGNANKL